MTNDECPRRDENVSAHLLTCSPAHPLTPSSLSVAIIARDEARHIGDTIRSVQGLADEVLVLLDARTADRTAQIAAELGARVVVEPWRGFGAQRNRALALCRGAWVLFLDADERVTPELRAEILQIADCRLQIESTVEPRTKNQEPADGLIGSRFSVLGSQRFHQTSSIKHQASTVGYWLPRHNQFFGTTLRGGGWYPDRQLRLLRRGHAHYDEARLVHEYAELDGAAGELHGHLLHLNIERLDELWRKQRRYAIEEAQTLFLAGRRARWRNFAGGPLREFVRRFVQLQGWRDGMLGLFLCATLAYFEWVKFVHLKGMQRLEPRNKNH